MFDAHPPPTAASLVPGFTHVRATEDGTTYVKVVGLPPPPGTFEPEAVWVRIVEGDPLKGHGIVDNRPIFCTEVGYGDKIEWDSADADHLPFYVGVDAPAAELVPLAPPVAAAPVPAGATRVPAVPVKGTRYKTKYGQWFEFTGATWEPIEAPDAQPTPIPARATAANAAAAFKTLRPEPAPVPAPTPIPTPSPASSSKELPPGVIPGPVGVPVPARWAATGHPGLPAPEKKVVPVPARLAGRATPPAPAAPVAPVAVPARVGRRQSQAGGAPAVPARRAHRPPPAATGPVPVPARVAAERDREAKAQALRDRQAAAAAKKVAAEQAAAQQAEADAQQAAIEAAAAAAVAKAQAAADAKAAADAQTEADAAAAAEATAGEAVVDAIEHEDLGDLELEPEVAAVVEERIAAAEADLAAANEDDDTNDDDTNDND